MKVINKKHVKHQKSKEKKQRDVDSTDTSENETKTEKKSNWLNPVKNVITRTVAYTLIFLTSMIMCTITVSEISGITLGDLLTRVTYWLFIAAVLIIFSVNWSKGQVSIDAARKISIWLLAPIFILYISQLVWEVKTDVEAQKPLDKQGQWHKDGIKKPTVKGLALINYKKPENTPTPTTQKQAQAPSQKKLSGETLTINLQADEEYTVKNVRKGQKWRYISFNGEFEHRINKGDNKATWTLVNNNKPWNASWKGKLQIKAGDKPIKLKIHIS